MSRFYVPKENIGKKQIMVSGKEAHHLLDVMRMKEGDSVVVFDGTGNEYTGYLEKADPRAGKAIVEIVRAEKPLVTAPVRVTLAQAIPKMNKMDHIVEKATELGVESVIPMISARTIVRPAESACRKKVDRWRKIAVAAAKQCGRADIPRICDVSGYRGVVDSMDSYDLVLMAHLEKDTVPLKEALESLRAGNVLVLIGPEGDFQPDEIALAEGNNCRFVSLGKRVLKSDTAGLFVLAVLNYAFSV